MTDGGHHLVDSYCHLLWIPVSFPMTTDGCAGLKERGTRGSCSQGLGEPPFNRGRFIVLRIQQIGTRRFGVTNRTLAAVELCTSMISLQLKL